MQVSEEMLDPELRSAARRARPLTWLLKQKRGRGHKVMNALDPLLRRLPMKGIESVEHRIVSRHGGPPIRVLVCRPSGTRGQSLPGVMYVHGGGYASGSPEVSVSAIRLLFAGAPCVIVAPAYRRSMTEPWPAGFDDCWDTLCWLRDNAGSLGVTPDGKFAVAGHSAGGGMTAALSLKARDTGEVDIAFQMPIYPMIDDRQASESAQLLAPVWGAEQNAIGWDLYLRGLRDEGADIPAYAAPARATDLSRLPPTVTFVGGVDPFRDETVAYVDGLREAGVPVTFELFDGAFHGFDQLGARSSVAQAANRFTRESFADHVERYLR